MDVAAAEHSLLLQRLVFDGCIGTFDGEICRRPYHRNCGCALHRSSSGGTCRRGGSLKVISFRTRVASAETEKLKEMASKVAEASWLLCLLEGCISAFDSEIKRRPYHRNCSCALHKTQRSSRGHPRPCAAAKVSYPLGSNVFKPLRLAYSVPPAAARCSLPES
ncbi:hypothetical protein ZIOFF_057992 [Zingiber officinale]|uniref:Uncharacterized protein n=1 Tax=Zingiber officinale TaxID=94328 RepID=A0A8J5F4A0_ZINOF|nr:hypothetical protein ZIOFF_057992 [Zingiber officinale]